MVLTDILSLFINGGINEVLIIPLVATVAGIIYLLYIAPVMHVLGRTGLKINIGVSVAVALTWAFYFASNFTRNLTNIVTEFYQNNQTAILVAIGAGLLVGIIAPRQAGIKPAMPLASPKKMNRPRKRRKR